MRVCASLWRVTRTQLRQIIVLFALLYGTYFFYTNTLRQLDDASSEEDKAKPDDSARRDLALAGAGRFFKHVTKPALTSAHKPANDIVPNTVPPEKKKLTGKASGAPGKKELAGKASNEPFYYTLKYEGQELVIEDVLAHPSSVSFKERMTLPKELTAKKSIILMYDTSFTQQNLGGCPDWNCEIKSDRSLLDNASAVMISAPVFNVQKQEGQYFVHFSQESPKNSYPMKGLSDPAYYNMTLGFRHDSPTASPYGYTVKLAPQSRRKGTVVDEELVKGKTKAATWFVSHCPTNSAREKLVQHLQNYIEVDIYGGCGPLKCMKGSACENSISTEYHFYMALENSICQDYITEKLWSQGFRHTVIPVVLKRSYVEPFAPPKSFIAVDDFKTVEDLGAYMKTLMEDKKLYMSYFEWRRDYEVVFLNGLDHDELERPWGFCQLCRLTQLKPRPTFIIPDMGKYWDDSCEADGDLVARIISASAPVRNITEASKPGRGQNFRLKIDDSVVQSAWKNITS